MAETIDKLKIDIDSAQFREDLQALADEIKADMAKSLETQVRMIGRDEMDKHVASAVNTAKVEGDLA